MVFRRLIIYKTLTYIPAQ